jgi:hypothetical protein
MKDAIKTIEADGGWGSLRVSRVVLPQGMARKALADPDWPQSVAIEVGGQAVEMYAQDGTLMSRQLP